MIKSNQNDGKYNMNGLLDFLKQGYQDSGLQELGNSIASQPKMYDPHANAQALMGGTPMQYNQQSQGLLNNVFGEGTDTFANETGSYPTGMIGEQVDTSIGPDMGQVNRAAPQPIDMYPTQPPVENPYNPAMIQPEISPWGSAPQEGMIGVDSKPPYSLLGDPIELEKKIREMEEAKLRLPWYLGGK